MANPSRTILCNKVHAVSVCMLSLKCSQVISSRIQCPLHSSCRLRAMNRQLAECCITPVTIKAAASEECPNDGLPRQMMNGGEELLILPYCQLARQEPMHSSTGLLVLIHSVGEQSSTLPIPFTRFTSDSYHEGHSTVPGRVSDSE